MPSINFLSRIIILLLIATGILNIDHFAHAQEKAEMIKIGESENDLKADFSIMPSEIKVKKETIVIWVNFINGPEINIEFSNPDAVIAATKDAKGFYMDEANGVFSAKYLPFIATASIRFIKSGEYVFSVKSQDGEKSATGKVIVK